MDGRRGGGGVAVVAAATAVVLVVVVVVAVAWRQRGGGGGGDGGGDGGSSSEWILGQRLDTILSSRCAADQAPLVGSGGSRPPACFATPLVADSDRDCRIGSDEWVSAIAPSGPCVMRRVMARRLARWRGDTVADSRKLAGVLNHDKKPARQPLLVKKLAGQPLGSETVTPAVRWHSGQFSQGPGRPLRLSRCYCQSLSGQR